MPWTTIILFPGPLSSLFLGVAFLTNFVYPLFLVFDELNQQQRQDSNGFALTPSPPTKDNKKNKRLGEKLPVKTDLRNMFKITSNLRRRGHGTIK